MEINDTVPNTDSDNNSTNEEINSPITVDEIIQAVKILKNNKSPGRDDLLNKYFKSSLDLMLPIYLKLFSIVLDRGVVPDTWLIWNKIPIYKDKVKSAENYRPITMLSRLGKLFTANNFFFCPLLLPLRTPYFFAYRVRIYKYKSFIYRKLVYMFVYPCMSVYVCMIWMCGMNVCMNNVTIWAKNSTYVCTYECTTWKYVM